MGPQKSFISVNISGKLCARMLIFSYDAVGVTAAAAVSLQFIGGRNFFNFAKLKVSHSIPGREFRIKSWNVNEFQAEQKIYYSCDIIDFELCAETAKIVRLVLL